MPQNSDPKISWQDIPKGTCFHVHQHRLATTEGALNCSERDPRALLSARDSLEDATQNREYGLFLLKMSSIVIYLIDCECGCVHPGLSDPADLAGR